MRAVAVACALVGAAALTSAPPAAAAAPRAPAVPASAGGHYRGPEDGRAASPRGLARRAKPAGVKAPHHVDRSAHTASNRPRASVVSVNAGPHASAASPQATTSPGAQASATSCTPSWSLGADPLSISRDDEFNFSCDDVVPPDTQFAAGPNAAVELVNDMGSIVSHGGGGTGYRGPFDSNAFFLLDSSGNDVWPGFIVTDPKIVYDAAYGRWYMTVGAFDRFNDGLVFLAVSQSNDPGGNWWIYTALDQSTAQLFCDQPRLGFSYDNILIACDNFGTTGMIPDPLYMVIGKSGAISGHLYEYDRSFGQNQVGTHMNLMPAYGMSPFLSTAFVPALYLGFFLYHSSAGIGVLSV